ncbi:MAG TPA: hypothetical protein DHU89_06765 [Flavobacteriales bacterium]|nr:hypothetical protein [Flavobacteriales bacterium]|tara:strand:+ start:435 stop:686 length:252 start_codon:yes stop_codon:yes gene_type:complete
MKNKIQLSVMILLLSSLIGCGYSACDCAESLDFVERTGGFGGSPPNMTSEAAGQCVRDYYSSGTLGESSAVRSALKNARKKCN